MPKSCSWWWMNRNREGFPSPLSLSALQQKYSITSRSLAKVSLRNLPSFCSFFPRGRSTSTKECYEIDVSIETRFERARRTRSRIYLFVACDRDRRPDLSFLPANSTRDVFQRLDGQAPLREGERRRSSSKLCAFARSTLSSLVQSFITSDQSPTK